MFQPPRARSQQPALIEPVVVKAIRFPTYTVKTYHKQLNIFDTVSHIDKGNKVP
jgi:hypothetical protein